MSKENTRRLCETWAVYWICPREDREKLAVKLSELMDIPMTGDEAIAQLASFNETIEMRAEQKGMKGCGLKLTFDQLTTYLKENSMEFNFKNIRDVVTSFAISCELID